MSPRQRSKLVIGYSLALSAGQLTHCIRQKVDESGTDSNEPKDPARNLISSHPGVRYFRVANGFLSKRNVITRDHRTAVLLVAGIVLLGFHTWEAGGLIAACGLVAFIPGGMLNGVSGGAGLHMTDTNGVVIAVYYAVYTRRGLNGVHGYDLSKVPLWRSF